MKKSKFILLSLISLSLVGCGPEASSTPDSTTSENPLQLSTDTSSSNPTSSVTGTSSSVKDSSVGNSSVEDNSSKENSSVGDNSSVEDNSSVGENSSVEDSSTSSSVDPYSIGWTKSITDTMLKYLNGQVIPLISVGKYSEIYVVTDASNDVYHLEIEGTNELDATILTNANTNFTNAGWTIGTNSTTKLTATLASAKGDLSVEITKDSSDFVLVKIGFDEPYDPTTASAWDSEVEQDFMDHLAGIVPTYVYLGSANPVSTYDSYDEELVVRGGKWNDNCVADIKAQLGTTWTITDETTTGFTAHFVNAADSSEVTMVLSKSAKSSYGSFYLITATYTVKEAYDAAGFTAWPQNILDVFDTKFGSGVDVPTIYLGTKSPTDASYSSDTYATIEGSEWDNRMLTDAKALLDADNDTHKDPVTGEYNFTEPETAWTYTNGTDSYGVTLTMTKTFPNGSKMTLVLGQNYYGKARLKVTYEEPFAIPAGYAWPQDVLDDFDTYLDGHVLPLVYLNTPDPTSSWYSYSGYLSITGSTWTSAAVDAAKEAFTNANVPADQLAEGETNWVYTYEDDGDTYYPYYYDTWRKTFADGCIITVQSRNFSTSSYIGNMYLNVYIDEAFNPDAVPNKAWTQDILDDFDTYFDGNTIPYFYTGTKVPQGSWSSYSEYYEITGAKWNDQVADLAKTAFAADTTLTWTCTEGSNSYGTLLTFTSTATADNHSFKVEVGQDYYENVDVKIYFTDSYDKAAYVAAGGKWNDATNDTLANMFAGHTLPNFYLATTAETTSLYASYVEVDITGGAWDDRLITDCQADLDADIGDDWNDATTAAADTSTATWAYTTDTYDSAPRLFAWKKLSDGGYLRFKLFKSSGKAKIYSWYDAPVVAATNSDWTDDQKTLITNTLGITEIPFFTFFGDATVTANSSGLTVKPTGTFKHSNAESLNIYDTFIAAGYTSDSFERFYSDAGSSWSVSKDVDNKKVSVKYSTSTTSPSITITAASAYVKAQPGEDWTDDVKTKLTTTLGFTIPYVNIGTVTTSIYTNNVVLKGSTWDNAMFDDAREAFEADGWDCAYDYSSSYNGKTLIASKEVTTASNETKHLSLKFYDYGYNSSYNPHQAYFDIYIR